MLYNFRLFIFSLFMEIFFIFQAKIVVTETRCCWFCFMSKIRVAIRWSLTLVSKTCLGGCSRSIYSYRRQHHLATRPSRARTASLMLGKRGLASKSWLVEHRVAMLHQLTTKAAVRALLSSGISAIAKAVFLFIENQIKILKRERAFALFWDFV